MNTWVSGEFVQNIGWTLLHFLWQGLAIGALLAIGLRLLKRHAATHRYIVGCIALAFVIAAPIFTFNYCSSRNVVEPIAPSAPAAVFSNLPKVQEFNPPEPTEATIFVRSAAQRQQPAKSPSLSVALQWLVLAWFTGVLLLSSRLFHGWWRVNWMRRAAGVPLAAPWPACIAILSRRLGINRPLRVVQSALVEVPTVIGWLRPVILLPASSIIGLTPAQLEAVLAHELAHIRRHDYLVNLLQGVVETLLFYHPVVWWISRRIREERENCCDDLAVTVCGDPVNYARALATLEELRPAPAQLSLAASGAPLLKRIKRLLSPPDRATRPAWPLAGIVVLLLLAGVAFGLRGHRVMAANANTQPPSASTAEATSTNSTAATTNAVIPNADNQTDPLAVTNLIRDGKYYYKVGRLDEAEAIFNLALQKDPSSVEANFYMRLVKEKQMGTDIRRDDLVSEEALLQVGKSWDLEQRNAQIGLQTNALGRTNIIHSSKGRQNIRSKLDTIRIPSLKFENPALVDAVKLVSNLTKTNDPQHEGINFMIDTTLDAASAGTTWNAGEIVVRLDTTLTNVRLGDVLDVLVKCADKPLKYEIKDYAVVFRPRYPNEPPPLEIRTFRVDTNLMQYAVNNVTEFQPKNASTTQASSDSATAQSAASQSTVVPKETIGGTNGGGVKFVTRENSRLFKQFVEAAGISFPNAQSGRSFIYNERKGLLTVRATSEELDRIGKLINELESARAADSSTAPPASKEPQEDNATNHGAPEGATETPTLLTNAVVPEPPQPEAESTYAKKKSLLDRLKKLSPTQLRLTLPTAVPDTILTNLLQDLVHLQTHLSVLVDALGPQHPDVRKVKVLVDDVNDHIEQRITGIMAGMEMDLKVTKNLLQGVRDPEPAPPPETRIRFKVTMAEVPLNDSKVISPGFTLACDPIADELGNYTVTEFIATGTNAFSTNQSTSRRILSINSGSNYLTAAMSEAQARLALQQFEQREGVDVLSAPQVINFDRHAARIEVSSGQTVVVGPANAPAPMSVFTGVSLGLVPHILDDGKSVEIEATPSLTEFLGYDPPPPATGTGGKQSGQAALPHFRVLEMKTKAVVGDGQTLVLGGPTITTVKEEKSKVPILGDLPIIKPLFRSKSSKTVTKHLVILITPTIIGADDKAGTATR